MINTYQGRYVPGTRYIASIILYLVIFMMQQGAIHLGSPNSWKSPTRTCYQVLPPLYLPGILYYLMERILFNPFRTAVPFGDKTT